MKKVIICGASGMVGGIVLRACLASSEIEKVYSIVRKPSGKTDSKLKEIVHKDFSDFSSIKEYFEGIDIGHFCVGVYTGQVDDDLFKKITVDFAKEFGNALKENSPNATLCFLSGAGADLKEKSRMSFAKYKGMAENHLMSQKTGKLYIFRPAYIYPVEKRKAPNFTYSISRKLYPLFKRVYSSGVITSQELANGMFKAGLSGAEKVILENNDIKKI